MAENKKLLLTLAAGLCFAGNLFAQSTHTTVRHRRVIEEDTSQPPELIQAENAIQKKDYTAAQPLLKKVVAADPNNYQAWFDLGFVSNALGNDEDSIAAYRKSVAAKPDVFESNLNLGLMLAKTSQPEAETFLRAATKLKPTAQVSEGCARAWISLGHMLAAKDPDGAIEAFHQAALLQPKDPEPHLSAGPLLEGKNKFADAEQEYKQAIALDPNSADAFTGLANIYMRGRRFGDAEIALRKLVALRPNNANAHAQLGRMLAADKRYDEAIAELQSTLKIAPPDLSIQRDLANTYLMAGKYVEAEAQYRALLSGNFRDPQLHAALGQALLKQRKFPEAQQELIGAVSLKPDYGEAWGSLAAAANENKNYPLVLRALEERAKFLPDVAICYFMRASAYDHLRNPKLAAENYHRFLETANGQYPDQEWQARHRLIAIEPKKK